MTESEDDDALIKAYLQNEAMLDVEAYLKRGRSFVNCTDAELDERWIEAFKIWAAATAAGVPSSHEERTDLHSEMQLRGREPPLQSVAAEMRLLQKTLAATLSKPELRERYEELGKEILDFANSGRTKSTH